MSDTTTATGERLAAALAAKDRGALLDLLDPAVDFRGLTPNQTWQAGSAESLVDDVLLGQWFEDGDRIVSLDAVETGSVGDRQRVAYRMRVDNAGGSYVVEQQVYYAVAEDRVTWLRVLCSGYRPIEG